LNKFTPILVAIGFATPVLAGNGIIVGNSDDWYLDEHWSDYSTGVCQFDTFPFGIWTAAFDGGGCTQVTAGHKLELAPAVATNSGVTHGALVFTNHIQGDPSARRRYLPRCQTEDCPAAPHWLFAESLGSGAGSHGTGNMTPAAIVTTFNYFVPKTNGWELGMVVNNGGAQGQIFLATGSSPTFPINTSYDVEIYHSNATQTGPGDQVKVEVNGIPIVTYTGGHGTPFRSGWAMGLYDEDSKVDFTFAISTSL